MESVPLKMVAGLDTGLQGTVLIPCAWRQYDSPVRVCQLPSQWPVHSHDSVPTNPFFCTVTLRFLQRRTIFKDTKEKAVKTDPGGITSSLWLEGTPRTGSGSDLTAFTYWRFHSPTTAVCHRTSTDVNCCGRATNNGNVTVVLRWWGWKDLHLLTRRNGFTVRRASLSAPHPRVGINIEWSGWLDLHQRPHVPETCALLPELHPE